MKGANTIKAKWKNGYGFYKADAQKVAEEILSLGDDVRPEEIAEYAKDKNLELHKCFEWDNSIAADKYRVLQARNILRMLVVKEEQATAERPEIRVFYKTNENEGYKPTELIIQQKDEYQALLERAWAELRAFKVKYSCLKELQDIFELID